jgi:hypothetical protein
MEFTRFAFGGAVQFAHRIKQGEDGVGDVLKLVVAVAGQLKRLHGGQPPHALNAGQADAGGVHP